MISQGPGWLRIWFKKKGFFLQLVLLILAILMAPILQYMPDFLISNPLLPHYSNTSVANLILAISVALSVFLLFLFNRPKSTLILIPALILLFLFLISVASSDKTTNSTTTLQRALLPEYLINNLITDTKYSNQYPGFEYDIVTFGYEIAIQNQHQKRAISTYTSIIKMWNQYSKIINNSFLSKEEQIIKVNDDWQSFKDIVLSDLAPLLHHQKTFTVSDDELVMRAELLRTNLNTIFDNFFSCTTTQSGCIDLLHTSYKELPPHLFLKPTPLLDFCHSPSSTPLTNISQVKINCPGNQAHIISLLNHQIQQATDTTLSRFGYGFFTTEEEYLLSSDTIDKAHQYLANSSIDLPDKWTPNDSASFKNASIAMLELDSILAFTTATKQAFSITKSIPPFLSFSLFLQHPNTQDMLSLIPNTIQLSSIHQPKDLLYALKELSTPSIAQDLATIKKYTKFNTPLQSSHPTFLNIKIYFNKLLLNEYYKYILGLLLFSLFIRIKKIFILKI